MENIPIIPTILDLFGRIWHSLFPPKPNLSFEAQDFAHWYNKAQGQSGIIVEMFIINRGKKPTTIRKIDIISMNPDHLQYKQRVRTKSLELPIGKDTKYRDTFFFLGDHLRYKTIKFMLEFTHTEGTIKLEGESLLVNGLEAEYKTE